LHQHEDEEELPAAEEDNAGHAKHVSFDAAPIRVEYNPALQSMQTVGPVAVLYFPAGHF